MNSLRWIPKKQQALFGSTSQASLFWLTGSMNFHPLLPLCRSCNLLKNIEISCTMMWVDMSTNLQPNVTTLWKVSAASAGVDESHKAVPFKPVKEIHAQQEKSQSLDERNGNLKSHLVDHWMTSSWASQAAPKWQENSCGFESSQKTERRLDR